MTDHNCFTCPEWMGQKTCCGGKHFIEPRNTKPLDVPWQKKPLDEVAKRVAAFDLPAGVYQLSTPTNDIRLTIFKDDQCKIYRLDRPRCDIPDGAD